MCVFRTNKIICIIIGSNFLPKTLVCNLVLMKKQFTEWHPSGIRNIQGLYHFEKVKIGGFSKKLAILTA